MKQKVVSAMMNSEDDIVVVTDMARIYRRSVHHARDGTGMECKWIEMWSIALPEIEEEPGTADQEDGRKR